MADGGLRGQHLIGPLSLDVLEEASFFVPDPGLTIQAHMAADHDRVALLEFLLTHELGHVLHSAFDDDPAVRLCR